MFHGLFDIRADDLLVFNRTIAGSDLRIFNFRVMPLMNSATGFRAHRMLEVVVKGITLK
ncbi:MAG: hypothetical protein HZC18_06545 [Candidatus Omnitrophica bacterium]|nr:hypothetical protein [Candidatus Omnitrophota bacterium]